MRRRGREHTTFGRPMKLMEVSEVFDPYYPFLCVSQRLPPGRHESKKKDWTTLLLPARCVRRVRSIFHRDVRTRGRCGRRRITRIVFSFPGPHFGTAYRLAHET